MHHDPQAANVHGQQQVVGEHQEHHLTQQLFSVVAAHNKNMHHDTQTNFNGEENVVVKEHQQLMQQLFSVVAHYS